MIGNSKRTNVYSIYIKHKMLIRGILLKLANEVSNISTTFVLPRLYKVNNVFTKDVILGLPLMNRSTSCLSKHFQLKSIAVPSPTLRE